MFTQNQKVESILTYCKFLTIWMKMSNFSGGVINDFMMKSFKQESNVPPEKTINKKNKDSDAILILTHEELHHD